MGTLDYPMFIVTTRVGERRAGCLIGFATQVSIHPGRFLACLSDKNYTYRVAQEASHLAVHFVPSHATELAELFGGETGDDVDKFARCSWSEGPLGLPILDDLPTWFAGRILGRLDAGDHEAFLLEPIEVRRGPRQRLFRAGQARPIEPGHEL
jgi:flavin reductase (DIM6/NTAB) family NADH-FMN oxidoreductase RutF